MANDHYISEFLTKPWAIGRRRPRLHYYDFKRSSFGDCRAETLFAAEGLHTEQTGQTFNRLVENPVNGYRRLLMQPGAEMPKLSNWNLYRALASFVWLQVQRDEDVRNPGHSRFSFDDLVAQGEAMIETVARIVHSRYELLVVALPDESLPLYFTEAVYFPIPMIGSAPILAVPLTPRHFVALPERDFSERQLEDWLKKPGMMSAFSVGLGGTADRVVIPPTALSARDQEPDAFKAMLHTSRESCRGVFDAIGGMNRIAGFRTFTAA